MRINCFIGILVSWVLAGYIYNFILFLVGKLMGYEMASLRFFVFDIVKEQGKIITNYDKPVLNCSIEMKSKEFNQKKNNIYENVSAVLMVIVSLFIIFLLWSNGTWINARFEGLLLGICVGLAAYTLLLVVVAKSVLRSPLRKKLNLCLQQLKSGTGYEGLDLSLEEIRRPEGLEEKKDLQNIFRCALLSLCNAQAYWMGDFERLKEVVSLEKEYFPEVFQKSYLGNCGDIVFYHSYIERDKEEARKYYNKAINELMRDTDVNGRRILAYYQYYVLENAELASQTLEQAKYELNHANRELFPYASLKMEKQLIDKLDLELRNRETISEFTK